MKKITVVGLNPDGVKEKHFLKNLKYKLLRHPFSRFEIGKQIRRVFSSTGYAVSAFCHINLEILRKEVDIQNRFTFIPRIVMQRQATDMRRM